MWQSAMVLTAARFNQAPSNPAPWAFRFAGKLVLEVLPAALASTIGAFLLAHYQFAHLSDPGSAGAAAATPASGQMLQLVHEEHDMIRDFLVAEQAAEKSRTTPDAADTRAVADTRMVVDAKPAAPPVRRVAAARSTDKPAARPTPTIVAASVGGTAPAALPTVLVAAAAPVDTEVAPPPAHPSLVSTTLAVPGHVVSITLHAVMAIGGIPSWIGHRVGAGALDSEAAPAGTAS